MKTIKFLALTPLLLASISFTSFAQKGSFEKKTHEDITSVLTDLTDAQKEKINQINQQFKQKSSEIKQDKLTTEDDKMKAIKELRNKKREDVNAVLTEKQREELAAHYKQQKDAKKTVKQEERAEDLVAKLDSIVKLTHDQKEKAKVIASNFIKERSKIKSNTALTEEQKATQLNELKNKQKTTVEGLLTAEQKEALKKHLEAKKEAKSKK